MNSLLKFAQRLEAMGQLSEMVAAIMAVWPQPSDVKRSVEQMDDSHQAEQVSAEVLTIQSAEGVNVQIVGSSAGAVLTLEDGNFSLDVILRPDVTKAVVRYLVDYLAVLEQRG